MLYEQLKLFLAVAGLVMLLMYERPLKRWLLRGRRRR